MSKSIFFFFISFFSLSIQTLSLTTPTLPFIKTIGTLASSPESSLKTNNFFDTLPLVTEYRRSTLKKQLVQACENKDENLVISLVEQLSVLNPTEVPTLGLAGYKSKSDEKSPLNGPWKLLFTNAKDAEAPARTESNPDAKFGDEVASTTEVITGQVIDASLGQCKNYIRLSSASSTESSSSSTSPPSPPFDDLEITIQMTPLTDKRVRLDFLRARVRNERASLPFFKDVTFNFPPRFVFDTLARLRGQDPTIEPQSYFDVLYIDSDIRAHRTGEGKLFVQKRDL